MSLPGAYRVLLLAQLLVVGGCADRACEEQPPGMQVLLELDPAVSRCTPGSGCCTPSCSGKLCDSSDGCNGTCKAGSGCSPCAVKGDASTLLLYTFEGSGSSVTDVAGGHTGTLVGSGATRVSGQSGCGKAMSFSGAGYLRIPDSTHWGLSLGSLDLWVRFDGASSVDQGIASRDANGSAKAGHLTLIRMCNGAIMARLQDTQSAWARCSKPVSAGVWHHVGLNFGGSSGLRLYIDGVQASETASISCAKTWPCGGSTTKGIAGNDNPWVLGAESWLSAEGSATPVGGYMKGRIDSFRISKVRRSF